MKGTISRLSSGVLLVTAIALAGILGAGKASAGPPPIELQFNPTFEGTLTTFAAGANPDLVVNVQIPDAGDAYFSGVIAFVPDDVGLGQCPANDPASFARACADGGIPNGAIVGQVLADSSLGLANGACNTLISDIDFQMMDATTDMSETVDFEDTNDNDIGDQFEIGSNGLPEGVNKYPTYLTRLIRDLPYNPGDPGASTPLQPIMRSFGTAVVAGEDVSVQFLIFQPGIMVNGLQLDPAAGFSIITVTQNTGDPGAIPEPSTITDQCTPFGADAVTYGITRDNPNTNTNEAGNTLITSPAPGQYAIGALLFSNRDEDNDGIENQVDPCPVSGNPDAWDPLDPNTPGDDDVDGIPNVCDPMPQKNVGANDHDGDQFVNRGDLCPLVANPLQGDVDRDGIGNECDPEPGVPSPILVPFQAMLPAEIFPAIQGDTDCDGDVDAADSLFSLRLVAGLGVSSCVNVGGDVNCDDEHDTIDALQIQRFVASLEVFQEEGCTPLEDPLA